MKNSRSLVDTLTTVVRDYNSVAKRAMEGEGKVFIPASVSSDELMGLIEDPSCITSQGNDGTEPCYASLDEGRRGQNQDGTDHHGFIVIDVLEREVVDLVDRNGQSKLTFIRVNGHGRGIGANVFTDILAQWTGWWVLVDEKLWTYHSDGCRCMEFHADMFRTRELALAKKDSTPHIADHTEMQITPDFISQYRRARGR